MEVEKILILDDDKAIRELVGKLLSQNGYSVVLAQNGPEMFKHISNHNLDLIILDLMLPGEDGFALCRKIRTLSSIPILMLTAKAEETDKVLGLEMGADDYLIKPFSPRELLARVKAIMRRSLRNVLENNSPTADVFHFSGWTLNKLNRQLLSPEKVEVILSAGEFNLLISFLERPQRILNRDQLLDITKNRAAGPYDRSIDVQISRIRQKIEKDPKNPALLKTVRSGGYILTTAVERKVSL